MTRSVSWLIPDAGELGVDEVGRGPLAGPVVAAAVMLDRNQPISGLRDSKRLSAKRREHLATLIQEKALGFAIGAASVAEIDKINILQASLLAMRRAVLQISSPVSMVYVDGNKLPVLPYPAIAIVGGDDRVPMISAASIIAKVYRDRLMKKLAEKYPQYGFEKNAGYGTAHHLAALKDNGPCRHHRRSFAPVKQALLETNKGASRKRQSIKASGGKFVRGEEASPV